MPTLKQIFFNRLIALVSCFSTLLLGLFCYFFLNITSVIPFIFWAYSLLILVNLGAFSIHRNLDISFFITAFLIYVGCYGIALTSGGINSPMLYVLPVIIIAGYIMRKRYGRWISIVVALSVVSMFILDKCINCLHNYVPLESRSAFSLLSLLLITLMLGGVLGDFMAKSSYQVYKSKQLIEKQNEDKEILLKEIHHRVKNNLQIVMSLLKLQGYQLDDDKTKKVFDESRNRIYSMALTHEMLYKGDDITNIGYDQYIERLVQNLIETLNVNRQKISLDLNIPDIKLTIDTAIPLGLLMNEIITNSIKYGLNKTGLSEISVTLRIPSKSIFELEISDNGPGFETTLNHETSDSLGLQLIQTLTEQLDGELERSLDKGTKYVIKFREQGV